MDFEWFWEYFWEVFEQLFRFFCEIVNMWKLAPRVHESSIFKVWRGLVLYIFVIFWVLVSGWLREWILSDFGSILRVILGAKIDEQNIEKIGGFWRDSGGDLNLR